MSIEDIIRELKMKKNNSVKELHDNFISGRKNDKINKIGKFRDDGDLKPIGFALAYGVHTKLYG